MQYRCNIGEPEMHRCIGLGLCWQVHRRISCSFILTNRRLHIFLWEPRQANASRSRGHGSSQIRYNYSCRKNGWIQSASPPPRLCTFFLYVFSSVYVSIPPSPPHHSPHSADYFGEHPWFYFNLSKSIARLKICFFLRKFILISEKSRDALNSLIDLYNSKVSKFFSENSAISKSAYRRWLRCLKAAMDAPCREIAAGSIRRTAREIRRRLTYIRDI